MTQLRSAGLLSRVLRLGRRRLFARPGCLVVDRDTRRTQPGQQYSSYRGRIESNILGVWWMCFAALQSERQVQLLAKVLNDEIDLIVSHDRLFLLILLPIVWMGRHGEFKCGDAGHVCAGPQASVMRFDDRTADRQPQPQTARFRGMESLEHALKSRRREAWT